MKYLVVAFCLALIAIVIAANLGLAPTWFWFVGLVPWGDKLGHFGLMGAFSFVVNLALRARRTRAPWLRVGRIRPLVGTLIVLAVVALEELSQVFLRYRSASLEDLACDVLGIVVFGWLAAWVWRVRERLSPPRPTLECVSDVSVASCVGDGRRCLGAR